MWGPSSPQRKHLPIEDKQKKIRKELKYAVTKTQKNTKGNGKRGKEGQKCYKIENNEKMKIESPSLSLITLNIH